MLWSKHLNTVYSWVIWYRSCVQCRWIIFTKRNLSPCYFFISKVNTFIAKGLYFLFMALFIYEVLFKKIRQDHFFSTIMSLLLFLKSGLYVIFMRKKKDKRSFYFKRITIRVEIWELVWTRKCLDSILSSLSPYSALNIYTLSRSCDAPLLSRALLSPLPGFEPSPPAQPSSRIWPRIAPGG